MIYVNWYIGQFFQTKKLWKMEAVTRELYATGEWETFDEIRLFSDDSWREIPASFKRMTAYKGLFLD